MICLDDMSDNRHEILQSTQITDPGRRRCLPPHPADPGCRHEELLRATRRAQRRHARWLNNAVRRPSHEDYVTAEWLIKELADQPPTGSRGGEPRSREQWLPLAFRTGVRP